MEKDEEYELIPVTPIRRLEKEIEKLKTSKGEGGGLVAEMARISKVSQKNIQKILESTQDLIKEVSSMASKLEATNASLAELLDMLKEASKAVEAGPEKPADKRFEQLRSRFEDLLDQNRVILDRLDRLEARLEEKERAGRVKREEFRPEYRAPRF